MQKFHYPRKIVDANEIRSQRTFELGTASLLSCRQGPGAFGGLHLHARWSESSALARRYHGKTVASSFPLIRGFLTLFDRTQEMRWQMLIEDLVADVLYLQSPDGGFYHASSEFEPTYTAEQSCPIHQFMPILALLEYQKWPQANPLRRAQIQTAIDAHWRWFIGYWKDRGNAWQQPMKSPGFCGVTDQDLVVVAALARYARLFNDVKRYEQFGRPVLETFLNPPYFHEQIGLFERGDQANFVERSANYDIVLPMLRRIHDDFPDDRIPAIVDNTACQALSQSSVSSGQASMMSCTSVLNSLSFFRRDRVRDRSDSPWFRLIMLIAVSLCVRWLSG